MTRGSEVDRAREAETDSATPETIVRWPIYLWVAQLGVPLPAIIYGLLLFRAGYPPGLKLSAAMAVSAAWVTGALVVVFRRNGQKWICRNRWQFVLLFTTTLITFFVCDVVLTLSGIVPTMAKSRSKSLQYQPGFGTHARLVPGQSLEIAGETNNINSRGLRGPEIAISKPDGITRILFLGGSQVYGLKGPNWPMSIGQHLEEEGWKVEIINGAVPGHRTTDSMGKLVADLWLLEPDVIVVCQAWNDIKYFSLLTPQRPYRLLFSAFRQDWRQYPTGIDSLLCVSAIYRFERVRLMKAMFDFEGSTRRPLTGRVNQFGARQYRLNLQAIVDVGRHLGAKVVLCKQARLPVRGSDKSDREKIGYHKVGLTHDRLVEAFALCDRIISEVTTKNDSHMIDMDTPMSGKTDLFTDAIHFTTEGQSKAAKVIAAALVPILKSVATAP